MPAGSKTGPPLAKAKPISASVITYLRSRKTERERAFAAGERMNEGSERAALVGTWPPARVNPPQKQKEDDDDGGDDDDDDDDDDKRIYKISDAQHNCSPPAD
ncbi:zinc finger protein 462-like [Grus japonensis]|uniref:Zinc finger protein 462-like n=1 Tax=Grus japonensis TaxID=30415 RepID=A0ABC9WZ09_GRUJA